MTSSSAGRALVNGLSPESPLAGVPIVELSHCDERDRRRRSTIWVMSVSTSRFHHVGATANQQPAG
jgi:hypothetical protein